MTLHNRYPSHRRLQARQHDKIKDFFSDFLNFDSSPTDSSTSATETTSSSPSTTSTKSPTKTQDNLQTSSSSDNDNTTTTSARHQHHDTNPAPHTTTSSSTTPETSTTTSTEQPESTSTSTSTEKTSDTPAKTSTTSHSSSSPSTSISTSSLLKPTSILPVTLTAATVTQTHTTGFVTPTSDAAATISATPSATPSTGLSTGAIVGSVAGSIAGLVAIFFIVAFLLRRWRRNRIRNEDFNPEDFVRSPNMTEADNGQNHSPFAPPNPAFRHHSIAPSISSGPNMAGQGTYAYGNDASYTGAAYTNAAHPVGGAAAGTAAYGTYEAHDDAINGAFSSDPKPQQAYNAEAYGSYAYSVNGSHAVTTGLQHAHPYSSTEYQAHYQDNALAHVPAPALVAGAPAVPANRAPSVYNVEDAYGGI